MAGDNRIQRCDVGCLFDDLLAELAAIVAHHVRGLAGSRWVAQQALVWEIKSAAGVQDALAWAALRVNVEAGEWIESESPTLGKLVRAAPVPPQPSKDASQTTA